MKDPATVVHSVRQRLLAHFEKSAPFAPEAPATEAAPADSGQLLYAPVTGRIRALTRIKDPVFSSEVLGKGCAIEPSCGEVVAPADGRLYADHSGDRDQQQPVCTDRAFALRSGNCRAAAFTRQNVKMGQKRPQTFLAHKSYNAFYSVTLW